MVFDREKSDFTRILYEKYGIRRRIYCLSCYYIYSITAVSYTHLRAHETPEHIVCRLLLEKKKPITITSN